MKFLNIHYLKSSGLIAAFVFTLLMPGLSQANGIIPEVRAGYDLFQTVAPATFHGIDFQGVGIGNFDFGGTIGSKNVGNTDTIIQRLSDVTTDGGSTDLAVRALQLVSLNPVSGNNYLYVTFDSNKLDSAGKPLSHMEINGATSGSGTFSSLLDFYVNFYASSVLPTAFDFKNPSNTGLLVNNMFTGSDNPFEMILIASNIEWSNNPAGLLIDNVTYKLNGLNTLNDFYPANFEECTNPPPGTDADCHPVTVPEPGILYLLAIAIGIFGFFRRKTIYPSSLIAA